ncbi:HET-domain-containing protein [Zopfia rhizophila CBS 207.26]|uniref:HET-domain-containing protein n=1 Tax=Zopfia rhizophila CBS 207.26 TaxID=1314779 RepID=A0A6A6DDQ9_9PEZI|nr:HET-domain-containing protein [Zopfia rhizophila CBS 207.26]
MFSSICCTCCSAIVDSAIVAAGDKANLSDIRAAAKGCQLCVVLLHALKRCRDDDDPSVQIVRTMSALKIGGTGPRTLRLCSDMEYSADTGNGIQISFPVLPEAEGPARFALLRAWLRWCDESHECNKYYVESKIALPTRLLHVGDPDDPHYDSDALHKKQFCTTQDNVGQRMGGFSISDLPKTFQDAIKVTRELRVPYLWIDSLCIIQYGDDGKDWEHESRCMEEVFSSAYCTIAATSAVDSNAGFLARNGSSEYVHVQDASRRQFYICADIDDYGNDVEKAQLNTRAWVMQERVLARRTIHFSANQTYFECGKGVYCETLTRMKR